MLYLHFQIKKKRKKNYVRKAIGIQQSKLSGFFFPLQCQRRRGKGPRKKKEITGNTTERCKEEDKKKTGAVKVSTYIA